MGEPMMRRRMRFNPKSIFVTIAIIAVIIGVVLFAITMSGGKRKVCDICKDTYKAGSGFTLQLKKDFSFLDILSRTEAAISGKSADSTTSTVYDVCPKCESIIIPAIKSLQNGVGN